MLTLVIEYEIKFYYTFKASVNAYLSVGFGRIIEKAVNMTLNTELMHVRSLSVIAGVVLRVTSIVGATLLMPALIGLIYGETYEAMVFLYVGLLTLSLSLAIGYLFRPPRSITIAEALVISGISWIVVAFIGGIPYVYTIGMSWVDAFFESMSGFTTTGMTLIKVIEVVPRSVLFWRALTQWLGGAGIVMLFLIFITIPSGGGISLWRLYVAEARDVRIKPSTWETVKSIWIIYLGLTVACILTLKFLGVSWFDSIAHAFTALATGGFSTKTASIAAFNNPAVEMALAFFSFAGGINFLAHYILIVRGPKAFFKYYEVKAAILIVLASTALISLDVIGRMGIDPINALRYAVFQSISIMTTTGYTTININTLPSLSKFILLTLMFIGGNLCSTGGAIKVGRIVASVKIMINQLQQPFLPSGAIKPVKIGTQILKEDDILRLFMFIMTYLIGIVVGTAVLTAFGYDPFQSLSAVASAQGNVGPCYLDLFKLNDVCRVLLALHMWLGRLELIPAITLLMPTSWRVVLRKRVE